MIEPDQGRYVFVAITEALRGSGWLAGWFGATAKGAAGNDIDVMVVQADRRARDPIAALRNICDEDPVLIPADPRVTFETWRLSVLLLRVDVHLHRYEESQA